MAAGGGFCGAVRVSGWYALAVQAAGLAGNLGAFR